MYNPQALQHDRQGDGGGGYVGQASIGSIPSPSMFDPDITRLNSSYIAKQRQDSSDIGDTGLSKRSIAVNQGATAGDEASQTAAGNVGPEIFASFKKTAVPEQARKSEEDVARPLEEPPVAAQHGEHPIDVKNEMAILVAQEPETVEEGPHQGSIVEIGVKATAFQVVVLPAAVENVLVSLKAGLIPCTEITEEDPNICPENNSPAKLDNAEESSWRKAIKDGDCETLKDLLWDPSCLWKYEEKGRTALHFAAMHNDDILACQVLDILSNAQKRNDSYCIFQLINVASEFGTICWSCWQ